MIWIPTWLLPPQEFKGYSVRGVKKVRIEGRIFPSALSAAQALGCSESRIRVMVYSGKAEYLD